MSTDIAFRKLQDGDKHFILSSWLKSYRSSPAVRAVPQEIYFEKQKERIESLLDAPRVGFYLAVNPESPEDIYGWLCAGWESGKPVVHYVYVKYALRGFGIAKSLVREYVVKPDWMGDIFYSHFTTEGKQIASKKGWKFDPY